MSFPRSQTGAKQDICLLAAREEFFEISCGSLVEWLELLAHTGAAGWRLRHGAGPEFFVDHVLQRDAPEPVRVWGQQFRWRCSATASRSQQVDLGEWSECDQPARELWHTGNIGGSECAGRTRGRGQVD